MKINEFNIRQLKERVAFLKEADTAARKGQQVNWAAFRTNLAGWAAQTGNPLNRIDAITWLGIAGHPEAVRLYQPTFGEQVRINSDPTMDPNVGGWYADDRFMGDEMDRVDINARYLDILNPNAQGSHYLAHEIRHRAFTIIRRIPSLINNMPADIRDQLRTVDFSDPRTGSVGAEHAMLYSMDSAGSFQIPDAENWRKKYAECNAVVKNWLSKQPIPSGAAEAFREDLERIYGKPVELVPQGQQPQSDPEAIAAGDIKAVEVPPKLANQTQAPNVPRTSAPDDGTRAGQQPNRTSGAGTLATANTPLARFARSGVGGLASRPDEASAISELQQRLNVVGYRVRASSVYDIPTRASVEDFQKKNGLTVDGDAGPETIAALYKATA